MLGVYRILCRSCKRKSDVCTLFVEVRGNLEITKVEMVTISSSF